MPIAFRPAGAGVDAATYGPHRDIVNCWDTIVEQVFREVRAFRIYDGPTEVHKWSLAKKVKRDWKHTKES